MYIKVKNSFIYLKIKDHSTFSISYLIDDSNGFHLQIIIKFYINNIK